MNLRVAGGIAGSIRVSGYLTQRRAHHTVLQFTQSNIGSTEPPKPSRTKQGNHPTPPTAHSNSTIRRRDLRMNGGDWQAAGV